MPRALITGITGQDGLYLGELLAAKGYEVFGLVRGANNPKIALVEKIVPTAELLEGDLRDLPSLIAALEVSQPDEVYNLAAISFVGLSWKQAELTGEITGMGVLRLLEAIRIHTPERHEQGALLPGVQLGDLRQGARGAPDRADGVPPALPVRRGQRRSATT